MLDRRTGRAVPALHINVEQAQPQLPIGRALVQWIATNREIVGVGHASAERLWDTFGPSLYDVIAASDHTKLASVLDHRKAFAILDVFEGLKAEVTTLKELETLGVDGPTAKAAIEIFGVKAGERFRENPYDLTLLEPWGTVDAAARQSGVGLTDARRLAAAVETAMAASFRTTGYNLGGHTITARADLVRQVQRLLGPGTSEAAGEAVTQAIKSGAAIHVADDMLQSRAAWHMERSLEAAFRARLNLVNEPNDRAAVDVAIGDVEVGAGFALDPSQREAVHMALASSIAFIAGGAGTGKSTILRAIVRASQTAKIGPISLVALSGRAARRMRETTGHPASTIYRFRKELEFGRLKQLPRLLVIDEVSMVGMPDLWLLATSLPEDTRILMVGDDGQLPPLQAGYPIRALMSAQTLPRAVLRSTHRQSAGSSIAAAGVSIREGKAFAAVDAGELTETSDGVFLAACKTDQVPAAVVAMYERLRGSPGGRTDRSSNDRDVQILTMTKKGPAGSEAISETIERIWMLGRPPLHDWGYHLGSKILWTQNAYDRPKALGGSSETIDIMNGALGLIRETRSEAALVRFDDGTEAEIGRNDLGDFTRGWAITVHKAQGSEFDAVIVPVIPSRLLDRTMLYTALTRAKRTVVLVGDPDLIKAAIEATPRIAERRQALNFDRPASDGLGCPAKPSPAWNIRQRCS